MRFFGSFGPAGCSLDGIGFAADFVHFAIVRFINDAHAARAQSPAQGEPLGTGEFSGCLNHVMLEHCPHGEGQMC